MPRGLALAVLVLTGFLVSTLASVGQSAAPLLRIRPVLTSNDPAGDDEIVCYVEPQVHANGYKDGPLASPATCQLEITDSLTIEPGTADGGRSPDVVIEHLVSPSGSVSYPGRSLELFYLKPGTELGRYSFDGRIGGRPLHGGFTVRLASKRILQLKFANGQGTAARGIVLAGYPPGAQVPIGVYEQVSFENVGTGLRRWRYLAPLATVTVDARGEASLPFPQGLRLPPNFMVVSEPQQQNALFSGVHLPDNP